RGLPRYHLPAILPLDVRRKVPNTKAGVVAARRDLHARRTGHDPCPAVDADRAGFRNDGLVAELTQRERVQKLRFCIVYTTAMRVGQTVGESHSQRRQVTPDHRLESPILALHDVALVIGICHCSTPRTLRYRPPAWSPHLARAETIRGPSLPTSPRGGGS